MVMGDQIFLYPAFCISNFLVAEHFFQSQHKTASTDIFFVGIKP